MTADLFNYAWVQDINAVKVCPETAYMPMSSGEYPASFIAGFLLFVYVIGPWWQSRLYARPTDDPSEQLRAYLGLGYEILTYTNLILSTTMTVLMHANSYSVWCQPINPSKEDLIAKLMWFFLVTKVVESFEVVLWLFANELQRANNFICYHHITSILLSWLAIKIAPGGTALVLEAANCWAHVIMYAYFTLKWKGYRVTPFRPAVLLAVMLHFIISGIICFSAFMKNCGFPISIAVGLICYQITLLIGLLTEYGGLMYRGANNNN